MSCVIVIICYLRFRGNNIIEYCSQCARDNKCSSSTSLPDLKISVVRGPLQQFVDRQQSAYGHAPRDVLVFVFQVRQQFERDPVVQFADSREGKRVVDQLGAIHRMYLFELFRVVQRVDDCQPILLVVHDPVQTWKSNVTRTKRGFAYFVCKYSN